jgi:hypothetical protein
VAVDRAIARYPDIPKITVTHVAVANNHKTMNRGKDLLKVMIHPINISDGLIITEINCDP